MVGLRLFFVHSHLLFPFLSLVNIMGISMMYWQPISFNLKVRYKQIENIVPFGNSQAVNKPKFDLGILDCESDYIEIKV